MRIAALYLLYLCVVCSSACNKPRASQNDDPAQAPLTGDELAQLLGIDHWKIDGLPRSDVPYWGVRVVALGADNKILEASTAEQFGTSITADGNNQVLVGIRHEPDGFSGTLMLGTRPAVVSLTRFTFPYTHGRMHGQESSIGLSWHDDRAELVSCTDENRQKTFSISVELLRAPPEIR